MFFLEGSAAAVSSGDPCRAPGPCCLTLLPAGRLLHLFHLPSRLGSPDILFAPRGAGGSNSKWGKRDRWGKGVIAVINNPNNCNGLSPCPVPGRLPCPDFMGHSSALEQDRSICGTSKGSSVSTCRSLGENKSLLRQKFCCSFLCRRSKPPFPRAVWREIVTDTW